MRSRSLFSLSMAAACALAADATGAVRYTFEYATDVPSLSVSIDGGDLINGLVPLRNSELAAGYPFNTNGFVPINTLGNSGEFVCEPSPLNHPIPTASGFHPATPDKTGATFTDGIEGGILDGLLADFLYPSGVFQFDLPAATSIGEIRVFVANSWSGGFDGRVFQNYDVAISTDSNPDTKERVFTPLINRAMTSIVVCASPGDGFSPNVNDGTQVPLIGATLTRVYDDASTTLATGVTSIRFTFWCVSNTQKVFRDQWLGPVGCPGLLPENVDAEDADSYVRTIESSIVKEIDVLAARTVVPEICSNGQDDDGDTLVDGLDPDCFGLTCPPEDCTNGQDDDGNTLIDCDDPDCRNEGVCNPEICDNQLDDDGDELVDCEDPDCAADPACLCHDPVFDLDDDNDVDLDDFAGFQLCYTGPSGAAPTGACACLDLNLDGKIAEEDFTRFVGCATRAFVDANPACDD